LTKSLVDVITKTKKIVYVDANGSKICLIDRS